MSKATKRWLGIAAALVLTAALCIAGFVMASTPEEEIHCYLHGDINGDGNVDKDDAIYLLYASFPGFAQDYPMQQDGKIDDNDVVNKDDAIYLLCAITPNMEGYELKGEVHTYYDPTWVWDETAGTATVTLKCACGSTKTGSAAFTRTVDKDPTCVATGSATLSVKVTIDGTEYTATQTEVIRANDEHSITTSCTADAKCADCEYEVKASGHKWDLVSTVNATCTAEGQELYRCSACSQTNTVTLAKLDHNLTYVENGDAATGNKCEFVKRYSCSSCSGVFNGTTAEDTYKKHTYVTTLTQEVTCCQDGKKTTACSECGDVQSEEILPMDTSKHVWNDGDPAAGKITFTCEQPNCGETKVEVVTAQDGSVDTTALRDTGVNLGDKTSMTMDKAALDALGAQSVKISVDKKSKDEIQNLSDEKKEQIGENTVYDFTMVDSNNKPITQFSGDVTISLPYTLGEDEDINSIDIWYISDSGEATRVNGTYSNGFVTFTTRHFSYYTVTRLTPAERCARLGEHIEVTQTKAATCTEEGYVITVCQRCGEVRSKTITPKLGHDYKTTTQDATCTADGQITETCQRSDCSYSVTRKLPALGHYMEKNTERSSEESCSAAGETVMVCNRKDCGYETVTPVPQRTHVYAISTVKATCTAGGYEIHVCESCGDELRKNETPPLGHNYSAAKAQWSWTENMTASVTLVCANDENHTRTQNAVVTQDTNASTNPSCQSDGSAVYTAVVSYNNQSYSNIQRVDVVASGHQPGTAWESTDSQHYHLCKVCNEKVDLQTHSWNQGQVAKEPTCTVEGSRTVSCTVCGFSQNQTIAPTGEHSFENGRCSSCGLQEGNCSHKITRRSLVDPLTIGICSDNAIYKFSCDCGDNVHYSIEKQGCKFGETTSSSEKDKYGNTNNKMSATCTKCGLVLEDSNTYRVDEEACYQDYLYSRKLTLDGVTVAYIEEVYSGTYHPAVIITQTVDLADMGTCGGTLTYSTCPCGQITNGRLLVRCNMEYVFDKDTMTYYDICVDCGMKIVSTERETSDKEHCLSVSEAQYTLYKGQEQIGSFTAKRVYPDHVNEVASYELLGDSCTDGLTINLRCATCGTTEEKFFTSHVLCETQETDLSSYDYCIERIITATCLCDEAYSSFQVVEKEDGCYFRDVMDKQTGEMYMVCMNCGIRMYTDREIGEKDADCNCVETNTVTYKNAEGATLATAVDRYESADHNFKTELELEEGATNCEDGVIVRESCVDCGYEYANTMYWHYTANINSYDLSAFGSCQTRLTLVRCACGAQDYVTYQGAPCYWERISTEENTYTDRCMNCGLIHTVTEARQESDHPCITTVLRVEEYYKEGVEQTVRFSREITNEDHKETFRLTLLEGATDCTGGYTVAASCDRCGNYRDLGINYHHGSYTLERTQVDNGKMCGVVYQTQVGCACGQNSDIGLEWEEANSCSFSGGSYNEVLDAWVYTCEGCGSFYSSKSTSEKMEGTTCNYLYNQTTSYYDKDNNFLFDYTYSDIHTSHTYVNSFTMQGESCTDGYYVTRTCSLCNYVQNDEYLYTDCQNWNLGSEQIHDGTDICGPITITENGCPCGNEYNVNVYTTCQMVYAGHDSQLGAQISRCNTCGLEKREKNTVTVRPGTCKADVVMTVIFSQGETTVLEVEKTYTRAEHLWCYSYTSTPASCEDGYGYSYSCFRCGAFGGTNDYTTGHSLNNISYTDLSSYGMCGGYLTQNACACGQNKSWNINQSSCTWEQIGGNEESSTYYCEGCDTYSIRTRTTVKDVENCRISTTENIEFVRDEQTLYTTTVYSKSVSHDETVVGIEMMNPGGSCEDGVRYTYACQNCDYIYTGISNYHNMTDTLVVQTSCGTKIYQDACPCGKRKSVSMDDSCNYSGDYRETGDENEGSSFWTFTCEDCGLRYTEEESWVRDSSTCMAIYTGSGTVEYGTLTETLDIKESYSKHSWGNRVYSLRSGSTSCLDGLNFTETCVDCANTYTSTYHGSHMLNVIETMDLADKGAGCGATLQYLVCPCGEEKKYDIDPNSECKVQEQPTELWIEDAILDTMQHGVEGQRWFKSTAYTFTCAVTEPACDLKLRMAEYWLVDDKCVATEYQTWQYLDSADNTWKTLVTLETGLVRAFHDYEVEYDNNTGEDGSTTYSEQYTCACGSSYRYERISNTDKTSAYKYTAVNSTTAEKYKATYQETRYGFVCNERVLLTYNHSDYTYHDDTTAWTEYNYLYNLNGVCSRKEVKTSSDGSGYENYQEHMEFTHSVQWTRETSCTQSGVGIWTNTCIGCGQVADSGEAFRDPYNHSWSSNPTGTYTCAHCGQESTNGASAGIVLEDMTDTHGNSTNYVVGYWNTTDTDFVVSVEVLVEGQEDLYLNIQPIYYNGEGTQIRAIGFNIADTNAAAAALAGDAAYTLKVNFIAGGVDYAITLDPVQE